MEEMEQMVARQNNVILITLSDVLSLFNTHFLNNNNNNNNNNNISHSIESLV